MQKRPNLRSLKAFVCSLSLCGFGCGEGSPNLGADAAAPSTDAQTGLDGGVVDENPLLVSSYLSDERAQEILDGCTQAASHRIPVISIRFFPTQDQVTLDPAVCGSSDAISVMRTKLDDIDRKATQVLEIGSAFRPAQDSEAHCSTDYEIVHQAEYLEALPLGPQIPNSADRYPDYNALMLRENICDWVDRQGVRQVWLWGYHFGGIAPAESNMAGPHGDISNSFRLDDLPVCDNTYTLFNYNFTRGLGEVLENHGHQVEAVLRHFDAEMFDQRFVGTTGQQGGARNGCGNVHFPPNGTSDYDWTSDRLVLSDCRDWEPGRNGTLSEVTCESWGCEVDGGTRWKLFWMNHIPGRDNGLTSSQGSVRNWWDALADFDGVTEDATGLHRP